VALGISVEIMLQGVVEGITAELNPRERAELSTQPGVDYIEEDKIVSIESTAIRNDAGCTVNSLGNVDDASSGSLPLGFNVNWFGTQYTGIIVNNNGGITFDDGLGDFLSFRNINLDTTLRPLILPLFTDLDTRASSAVTYGTTTIGGRAAYCINWVNVGEYSFKAASQSFQLVIIDQGGGNIDLEFNYGLVTTPSSSSNPTFVIGYADPSNRSNSLVRVRSSDATAPYANGGSNALISNRFPSTDAQAGRYTYSIRPTESVTPTPTPPTPGTSNCTPDAQTSVTWGLDRIDQRNLPLSTTYACAGDGTGVNAYIVDTGIYSNNDFSARLRTGISTVPGSASTVDCHGHGTHVAGTVGGTKYGVAKNVNLYPVRVLDCFGSGSTSSVISGLNWVASHAVGRGPAVVNMSLGGGISEALDGAVAELVRAGITVVVAAGNKNTDAVNSSPAREPSAITVGSTTSTDARSSFSNYGSVVDIFAPGSSITSAWIGSASAINTISGTSMAAPHVAGAAAVYLGLNPRATPAQVVAELTNAATPSIVVSPGSGSPNLLLYSRSFMTAPSTESVPPVSGGGSSGGDAPGGGGGSGGSDAPSSGGGAAASDEITKTEAAVITNQVKEPGQFKILNAQGQPIQLRKAELTSSGFSIAGNDWEIAGSGPLNSTNQTLTPGTRMTITGEGLQRLTTTGIYILSSPTWVGSAIVGYDNKFTANFMIPNLPAGNHSLQINMVRQGQLPVSIALGFTLDGTGAAAQKTPNQTAGASTQQRSSAQLIYFVKNSSKFTTSSVKKLKRLVAQAPNASVDVTAFTTSNVSTNLATKRAAVIVNYLKKRNVTTTSKVEKGVSTTQSKSALLVINPNPQSTGQNDQIDSFIIRYKNGKKPTNSSPLLGTDKVTSIKRTDLALGTYLGFGMYRIDLPKPITSQLADSIATELTKSRVVDFAEPNAQVSILSATSSQS
jgi:subtilisin family serine protease